jgi:hypothetical protein
MEFFVNGIIGALSFSHFLLTGFYNCEKKPQILQSAENPTPEKSRN